MNKDVKYNGYSAVPSDYECQDGELAMSLNLVPEDGALSPIFPPKEILSLASNEHVLLIHAVPGQKNYILKREGANGEFALWWLLKSASVSDTSSAIKIGEYNGYRDITIIGNTIVIATDSGIKYALWKEDSYRVLSDKPPFITLEFGMYRCGDLNAGGEYDIPVRCNPAWDGVRGGYPDKSELAALTQMAYGLLLSQVAERVTRQGLFYMPFFIRYAYRLYDGSYSWHSAPVLMLPTVLPPVIKYSSEENTAAADPASTIKATLSLQLPIFGLSYRILGDGIEELSDWSDIVSGIDVFISAPIYTYDQSKDLEWRPVTDAWNIICANCPMEDYEYINSSAGRPGYYPPAEVFAGHYAQDIEGMYMDHLVKREDNQGYALNIKLHNDFHRNIESEHTFYKLSELDVRDLKPLSTMTQLKFEEGILTSLVTRPILPDDYQSHCKLVATSLFAYNSRLSITGVKIAPAEPFPINSIMQFGNPEGIATAKVRITVWTRINGTHCYSVHNGSDEADIWCNPSENFPRYIYYPDASAYKMEIYISDSQRYIIDLTSHDFLNGAYWYKGKDGIGKISTPTENAAEVTAKCFTSVNVGSKIYTSEVNNPFSFPATNINTIGSGDILALSAVVKALSQGQFGQFPLYAFSTEGVWALEVSSTGGFISRQPVTRDVCINRNSILQIDSAVLFATDRGIMLIQGSNSSCISDTLNADSNSSCISDTLNADSVCSLSHLPAVEKILNTIGMDKENIIVAPFSEFIRDCRLIYDYPHQRIVIFRESSGYAYVYSLRSKAWGMMISNLFDVVNSYPEALAISRTAEDGGVVSCHLVDFSQTNEHDVSCAMLTRPLKLDAPNIFKTVDTVIQRGLFRKGDVSTVLYGSRDLVNWYLIWTSKDHYLRGFRGTPYKYFRIAGVATLTADENIYGASVQFTPRINNQPR